MIRLSQSVDRLIFQLSPSGYDYYNRARRKLRRQYETELQKHFRERQNADYLLISPTNCGRTWLRVMLGRMMQVTYQIDQVNLHYLYSFSELNPNVPRIKAIHEKYGQFGDYQNKKVIYLVRDPRDALVSRYHQHQQEYPDYPSLDDFILNAPDLIRYVEDYNRWQQQQHTTADFMTVRYEDLKANPQQALQQLAQFLALPITDDVIAEAVQYASFENMRKMELNGSETVRAGVLMTTDKTAAAPQENQLKVRKGRVGGYRQELSTRAIEHLNTYIQTHLNSNYGYSGG